MNKEILKRFGAALTLGGFLILPFTAEKITRHLTYDIDSQSFIVDSDNVAADEYRVPINDENKVYGNVTLYTCWDNPKDDYYTRYKLDLKLQDLSFPVISRLYNADPEVFQYLFDININNVVTETKHKMEIPIDELERGAYAYVNVNYNNPNFPTNISSFACFFTFGLCGLGTTFLKAAIDSNMEDLDNGRVRKK